MVFHVWNKARMASADRDNAAIIHSPPSFFRGPSKSLGLPEATPISKAFYTQGQNKQKKVKPQAALEKVTQG
jgi:hypothetical protein